jgi:hypothetical protein
MSLWLVTLWPERHIGHFFLLPLGYQRVNKNSIGGTIGKNLKKNNHHFSEKKGRFLSNFSLWSPLWNFYSPFDTPKEARKTGISVTLAKVSFWPKCHSGQSVSLAKVSLAKVSLAKGSL